MDFTAKILDIIDQTPDVKSFILEKPNAFFYRSGQWCTLDVGIKTMRPMTICSCPEEQHLEFTIKKKGVFTQELFGLKTGDTINIKGPFGKAIEEKSKLAFIAGGSGITPFMSFIRHTILTRKPYHIILFNSNRTEEDIIFKKEIEAINKTNNIKVINTLTRIAWKGEQGRVNKALILKYIPQPKEYEWHICGPASMNKEVKEILATLHVEKENEGYQ
jgi:glycine betaine catabolism B